MNMNTEDAFKNGYAQGQLNEIEAMMTIVNNLRLSTKIWDLQQAYSNVLDTLNDRRATLMTQLNWQEIL